MTFSSDTIYPMHFEGVLFIAADTGRSKAYAQILAHRQHTLDRVLILAAETTSGPVIDSHPPRPGQPAELFYPNLGTPLSGTCENISNRVDTLVGSGINGPGIAEFIVDAAPRLIVYSGFGGQIVGSNVLDIGAPFLHIHGGWLPEYRGSTTMYYSILNGEDCGVSALLLDPQIDTGPVVGRRRYPLPPPGISLDYYYDNALRADFLMEVLEAWQTQGDFENLTLQNPADGATYYIVHPLLKHIALLGRTEEREQTE